MTQPQKPTAISDFPGATDRLVKSLTKALMTDYAAQFKSAYPTEDSVAALKQRLRMKLDGMPHQAVIAAYEHLAESNPAFLPTIPQIVQATKQFKEPVKQREQEQAARLALPETPESRAARKAAGIAHLANLKQEAAYMTWLSLHANRPKSLIDYELEAMRAAMGIYRSTTDRIRRVTPDYVMGRGIEHCRELVRLKG